MIYNGSDAMAITTAAGKVGDFYLQTGSDTKMTWLTQKNFDKIMSTAFGSCPTIVAGINASQWNYSQLSSVVNEYNSCK